MKICHLFAATILFYPFLVLSDVQIEGNFLITDEQITTRGQLLNQCSSLGLENLSAKEFIAVRKNPHLRKLRNLINIADGKIHSFSNGRMRIVKDFTYATNAAPYYAICKGAAKISSSQRKQAFNDSEPEEHKQIKFMDMSLSGTVKSELNASTDGNLSDTSLFRTFLAERIVKEHHPEAYSDGTLRKNLIKYYKDKVKLAAPIGQTIFEDVNIYAERKRKNHRFTSSVSEALFQRFSKDLERSSIRYDALTGRILYLRSEQNVNIIERDLPKVAEMLAQKWQTKYFFEFDKYNYYISDALLCRLYKTPPKKFGFSEQNTTNSITIECRYTQPFEMLYKQEDTYRSFIDDVVKNPPQKQGLDITL
ncbi:hypothetical protein [Catenovulum adriaticum]|uniref:Uncharacterized protein n=1 Tax=Catenovulum adriaticum TaxID=2984846 RepID=A0ABY7ALD2_9ALTE|nr:hypothetical protein [Catenovulum sp. TS8]WAJ70043.1 hypothetical protein OLW01_12995 [Catenovulum sp. TS8]